MTKRCNHECVCKEYARNLSATYDPCGVTCEHDTRLLPPTIPLTPTLTQHYTERSQATGKPVQALVLQDLTALHKKRVAREESRVFRENEFERL
jgi:hypothetical protein